MTRLDTAQQGDMDASDTCTLEVAIQNYPFYSQEAFASFTL